MFHAARAILRHRNVDLPRTHSGLQKLFGKEVVLTGILPKQVGRSFGATFELRQRSDYEVFADLDAETVSRTIESAESFVELVEGHVAEAPAE